MCHRTILILIQTYYNKKIDRTIGMPGELIPAFSLIFHISFNLLNRRQAAFKFFGQNIS